MRSAKHCFKYLLENPKEFISGHPGFGADAPVGTILSKGHGSSPIPFYCVNLSVREAIVEIF